MGKSRKSSRNPSSWLLGVPLGRIGGWFLRLLGSTWRVHGPGPSEGAFVGALWHSGFICAAYLWRDRGYKILVSRSRDGDLIESVLGPLGYGASLRGSSSRGGTRASLGAIRALREGIGVAVLIDGPKGPALESKPGAVHLSQITGLEILPAAIAAKPAIRFRSWDRTILPLPFARVRYAYGQKIIFDNNVTEEQIRRATEQLENSLNDLTKKLYGMLE